MPGIPHLSGAQTIANDLLRAGGANADVATDGGTGSERASADAVQELEATGRRQRGADADRNDADVRRERARVEARALRARDEVELSSRAEAEPAAEPPRRRAPSGSLRGRFVGPEDPPQRRRLENVTA